MFATVPKAVELRVHGVGGDAPHRVLGLPYATDVDTGTQLRDRVALVRPIDDDSRSAYVWGELTSGSPLFALWTLVLPFTLANVAGWMHPPCLAGASNRRRHRIAAIRILVFANGLVLTAASVCWLATLLVGFSGYSRGTVFTAFLVAAAVGGAVTGSKHFEGYLPLGVTAAKHGLRTPTPLTDPAFFGGGPTFWRRWPWHLVVAASTCVAVLVSASHTDQRAARIGTWSMWLTTGGCALSLIVTLLSLERGSGASMWRWGGCGSVSALAHVLVAGVANALLVAIPASRRPELGRGLALLDVWGIAFAAGAAVAIVTAIVVLLRASPYENASLPDAERFLGGSPRAKRTARIAQLPRHVDLAITALATTAMIGTISVVVIAQRGWVEDWTSRPNWWTRIALVVLAPLVGVLVRDVRRNASSVDRRRRIGQIWDVMGFWPRGFHPLAVRPYSERAIPELIQILSNQAGDQANTWIVTAHSQGTVLAASAIVARVAPAPGVPPPRIELLTFGCPLRNLYAKAFPHYFGDHLFDALQARLSEQGGSWLNIWRATDPVGREMYASALCPHTDQIDVNLPQPNLVAPEADATATDLEQDTPLGAVDAHSGYRRSRLLRSAVASRRAT